MTICWDYLAALLRFCATVLKKSWEWFLGKSEKHIFGFWVQFPEMGVPLFLELLLFGSEPILKMFPKWYPVGPNSHGDQFQSK